MAWYAYYLIFISISIYENIRDKRKFATKLRGLHTKLLISQLLIALVYRIWYLTVAKTQSVYPVVQYANNLIQIFMNINENIGNYRKMQKKLRGYTYKITHISAASCPIFPNLVQN